jgi:hypothetical protein
MNWKCLGYVRIKLCCLIDEWIPLCLINVCKYGIWLRNDLITRIEGIKIPPLILRFWPKGKKLLDWGI